MTDYQDSLDGICRYVILSFTSQHVPLSDSAVARHATPRRNTLSRTKAKPKPARATTPGSLTDSLLRLQPGDDMVFARHLDPAAEDLSESGISATKTQLNNQVSKTVSLIRDATGGTYSVEGTVFSTTRNRLYAAMIVTRTE